MLVLKFGGTSVGSIENMTNVKNIINDGQRKVVVLSAMSGTTNSLVTISECIKYKEIENALELISDLHKTYIQTVNQLIHQPNLREEAHLYVSSIFDMLKATVNVNYSTVLSNKIVAQGELLSTFIFSRFLLQEGLNAQLLPALDFMRIDKFSEPDSFYIRQNFNHIINELPEADIYITQGFICLDAEGQIANL